MRFFRLFQIPLEFYIKQLLVGLIYALVWWVITIYLMDASINENTYSAVIMYRIFTVLSLVLFPYVKYMWFSIREWMTGDSILFTSDGMMLIMNWFIFCLTLFLSPFALLFVIIKNYREGY